jgi:hypothetical protein
MAVEVLLFFDTIIQNDLRLFAFKEQKRAEVENNLFLSICSLVRMTSDRPK